MKRHTLLLLTVLFVGLGFILMMGGLLYDVAFTGSSAQSLRPELAGEGASASSLATNLFIIGGGLASVGALAAVVLAFLTVRSLFGPAASAAGEGEKGARELNEAVKEDD